MYVSNIVYRRMMAFAFTSTASEQEIKATLEAAYKTGVAGVSGELSVKQQAILSEATIAFTSLGGDAQASLDLIQSGDWHAYFTENPPLSTAAPLSYTFRNLGDGGPRRIEGAGGIGREVDGGRAGSAPSRGVYVQHRMSLGVDLEQRASRSPAVTRRDVEPPFSNGHVGLLAG